MLHKLRIIRRYSALANLLSASIPSIDSIGTGSNLINGINCCGNDVNCGNNDNGEDGSLCNGEKRSKGRVFGDIIDNYEDGSLCNGERRSKGRVFEEKIVNYEDGSLCNGERRSKGRVFGDKIDNYEDGSLCNGEKRSRGRVLEEPALIRLKKERDPDRLFSLFKENARNRLLIVNNYAFEDTVSRLAGAGRYDYIEELLEEQKALPQGRREGFVVRIIMLYGMAGMVEKAVDTFYGMHLFGCKRTVMSLNATLKVLGQTKDLERIGSLLSEAPCEFGIKLDLVSVNIVVSAFCRMGIFDKAYLVVMEMEKKGIVPDVVTYTTLIAAFYKCGQWEIGNGLWNLMVYKGCYPNVATFNARIQFLVCRGRAWQANDLLRLMEDLEMPPDEVTYNLVIKGFCRAGFLHMARKVYSALHGRGHKPNVKIYQTMVHYLCKAGEFDSAYNMCKECMQKNWFLNVDTICTLVNGLKSIRNYQKAWMIIGLAERRVPPYPRKQLDAFKSILARR